jgi:hypothetical protein
VRAGPKAEITAAPLDLSTLPRSGARRVDQFAREYLKVTRGKGARGPFRLRGWQKQIVSRLFPGTGLRPRQALLSLPRGNGKTSLAAALGGYGLYADGVESAEVVVVAFDARQAGITLRQIARMVELEPRLAEQTQVFQSRLYVPHTDSTLVVLPAEPGALQGWNPSLAIVDELHVVTRQVWDAVSLAAGKRDRSLTLAISTPGPAREGVMWDLVEHGRRGDDPSFVYVEYAAPEGCEVDDEDAWAVANPPLGDFLYLDALRSTMRTTREADFRRYRLGSGRSMRMRGCRWRLGRHVRICGRYLPMPRWCWGSTAPTPVMRPRSWLCRSGTCHTWMWCGCGKTSAVSADHRRRTRCASPLSAGGYRRLSLTRSAGHDRYRCSPMRVAGGGVPAVTGPDDAGNATVR